MERIQCTMVYYVNHGIPLFTMVYHGCAMVLFDFIYSTFSHVKEYQKSKYCRL